ncbi:hypothetical protein B0A66_19780 [Flavobacterium hercynium]|uniref:Uncharacterized protein n=1 Tax=Flavobacterium hercynium TaxID=387094 RepID=A0A226GUX0_9FLAO|nr:hypothetical protein B0A66_19780 [Flavobacterium hercynium]
MSAFFVVEFLKLKHYKYQIMIKVKLKFVIRNSSSKTPKKSGSILIVIQKLINSLMKNDEVLGGE